MSPPLIFVEQLTGWDVQAYTFSFSGGRVHTIGRFEEAEDGWAYFPSDGDSLSLSELDQIRHKLANLEQARITKEALDG